MPASPEGFVESEARRERVDERGRPGFFRMRREAAGPWWLLTPAGAPVWGRAIERVRRGPRQGGYARVVAERFGDDDGAAWADDVRRRAEAWGFNACGPGAADEVVETDWPALVSLDFATVDGRVIRLGGAQLPDVFDGRWVEACAIRAAERAPAWRGRRGLIAWVTDTALGWPGRGGGRSGPGLLQVCLSLEPAFAAYHAAWEFVLARHGGDLETVARAWEQALPGRLAVRQRTQAEVVFESPGWRRDDEAFGREFARRYLTATVAAVRGQDADHLIFAAAGPVGAERVWRLEAAAARADAAMVTGASPRREAAGEPVVAEPVWVTGFGWHGSAFTSGTVEGEPDGLSGLETMLRRGRATLEAWAADPACVGYGWGVWAEGEAGRVPPFRGGLVYENDQAAVEHVEPLTAVHARAESRRRGGGEVG